MKKLKMIVTSVVVLAIVGSAFTFKEKKIGVFCVLTSSASGANCTGFLKDKYIVASPLGSPYKYASSWDYTQTACTTANNGLCTASIRLASSD